MGQAFFGRLLIFFKPALKAVAVIVDHCWSVFLRPLFYLHNSLCVGEELVGLDNLYWRKCEIVSRSHYFGPFAPPNYACWSKMTVFGKLIGVS